MTALKENRKLLAKLHDLKYGQEEVSMMSGGLKDADILIHDIDQVLARGNRRAERRRTTRVDTEAPTPVAPRSRRSVSTSKSKKITSSSLSSPPVTKTATRLKTKIRAVGSPKASAASVSKGESGDRLERRTSLSSSTTPGQGGAKGRCSRGHVLSTPLPATPAPSSLSTFEHKSMMEAVTPCMIKKTRSIRSLASTTTPPPPPPPRRINSVVEQKLQEIQLDDMKTALFKELRRRVSAERSIEFLDLMRKLTQNLISYTDCWEKSRTILANNLDLFHSFVKIMYAE